MRGYSSFLAITMMLLIISKSHINKGYPQNMIENP